MKKLNLEMSNTCDPEFILWKNIGVRPEMRFVNKIRSICFMIIVVIALIIMISYYTSTRQDIFQAILPELGSNGPKNLGCSAINPSKDIAYNSMLSLDQSAKITIEMFCYCQKQMIDDPFGFTSAKFGPNETKYCSDWFGDYTLIQILLIVPSIIIQLVNVCATFLFIFIAKAEGQPVKSVENASIFFLIFI